MAVRQEPPTTSLISYALDPSHAAHSEAGHPERPERLDAVVSLLEATGRLARMRAVTASEASVESLEKVHDPSYLDLLEALASVGGGRLDPDTYCTPASYGIARRAVGGLLAVTNEVLSGAAAAGFALARPPGHHARAFTSMGFCLLANVAIAVRHAQMEHGVRRVMVVDFDVHHGNGTQEAFYDDPDVLVVSSHQYPFWPGTGAITDIGVGDGEGATINIPLPAGSGDRLAHIYERVLPPLASRFRPEVVFLSAGYDAHWMDPLGGLTLSLSGLNSIVRVTAETADQYAGGRVIASLEGGYHAGVLAAGVAATVDVMERGVSGAEDPFGPAPTTGSDLVRVADALLALHGL